MKTGNISTQPQQPIAFFIPVLIGAGIALALISFVVFGADCASPEWGQWWRVRPLIITPLAGAMGGVFFYVMDLMACRGMNRTVAVLLSIVVYVIGLWLGTVLGLVGTMWN